MRSVLLGAAAVSLLFSWSPAHAQVAFELKGYSIGQAMAECPEGTVERRVEDDGLVLCALTGQTFANEPNAFLMLRLYEGKVHSVAVSLPERGLRAGGSAYMALRERWGHPDESKSHINWARWTRGSLMLTFDGYKGIVMLVDEVLVRERGKKRAVKNKSDT